MFNRIRYQPRHRLVETQPTPSAGRQFRRAVARLISDDTLEMAHNQTYLPEREAFRSEEESPCF